MMKKFILIILIAAGLISSNNVLAQATFTIQADTVFATYNQLPNLEDAITVTGANAIINWKVIATNFPPDWLTSLGICDNNLCYNWSNDEAMWNGFSGATFTSNTYYHDSIGDFHLQFPLPSSATNGTFYIKINLSVQGSSGDDTTEVFVITKFPTSVPTIGNIENIVLYPNPARNDINVVYGQNTGVKNIAVYNIIGKILTYYKVSGSSANLDITNIPSGIYFLRLLDGNGNTVATRKFTRQ